MGKLIVVEGTDCSGKETQTKKLIEYLEKKNEKVIRFSFPMYDSPTGKIIGGPFLGKDYISNCWFPEGPSQVDGKVASLYYAADRLYNLNKIIEKLNEGYTVILDRYTYSNMAHQGGKLKTKEKREEIYDFIYHLEFELLNLPKPDLVILLYMPVEAAEILRKERMEKLDEVEKDNVYLKNSERAYLELAEKYNFLIVNCAKNDEIRTIDEIFEDVKNIYLNNACK